MKFGRLEILEYVARDKHGKRRVRCRCDCGNIVVVNEANLFSRRTKSCGCLKREPAGGRDRSKPVNRPSTGVAQANSQSGARGVSMTKQGKWRADIQVKGIKKYLGVFETVEEAKQARDEAENELTQD